MSSDVNNGNSNGPGVPKTNTCLEHVQLLIANINNNKEELFGKADDSKVSGKQILIGYVSRAIDTKIATNNNVDRGSGWNVAAHRTRNQRRNVREQELGRKIAFHPPGSLRL